MRNGSVKNLKSELTLDPNASNGDANAISPNIPHRNAYISVFSELFMPFSSVFVGNIIVREEP